MRRSLQKAYSAPGNWSWLAFEGLSLAFFLHEEMFPQKLHFRQIAGAKFSQPLKKSCRLRRSRLPECGEQEIIGNLRHGAHLQIDESISQRKGFAKLSQLADKCIGSHNTVRNQRSGFNE